MAEQRVMVAQVPVSGVRTPSERLGDGFAWLSLIRLVSLIGLGELRTI